ncbi:MAG: ribosomal RNA small subunit methyltransferase A [Clostridia bacterium]|nr:ribosomal RNA small subunit methyltransferase A [Clostridia bacterium]
MLDQSLSLSLRARMAMQSAQFQTSHALGQNFILNEGLLSRLLDEADVREDDVVLEIGPGCGVMTALLSARCRRVYAFEIDGRLQPVLESVLSGCENARVQYVDFMKVRLDAWLSENVPDHRYRVVANLPYYITTDLIAKLITHAHRPDSIAVMVQREAADRLLSHPGEKNWCAIAALLQTYGTGEILEEIPSSAFEPEPHVESCFIQMERKPLDLEPLDADMLYAVIRSAFAMRRKKFTNNLKQRFPLSQEEAVSVLREAGVDENVRGEALPIDALVRVSNAISTRLNARKLG